MQNELNESDLSEKELEWYKKRVRFFNSAGIAAPSKMLLAILKKGRE